MDDIYRVEILPMGRGDVPGPELYWMRDFDHWYELLFQALLIRNDSLVVLVNTGAAEDLSPMNEQWASFLGERAALRRQPGEFIIDALADRGVAPEDVTDIILTPLQLYTVSNIDRFPNARVWISRRGWIHFHTTWSHPHDDRDSSLPPNILQYLVGPAWPRVRLLDDEHEIAPGLRTWWAGTHHRATVCVECDTAAGVMMASDAMFYLDNVQSNHPIGINESMDEALTAYARVREHADLVVALYDPGNLDRFPGGVVA